MEQRQDHLLDDDSEWISKSQLKRESKDLQRLGKQLCHYNQQQLAQIPIDETLRDAIELAHKLTNKRAAQKRHFQYIGKLLRKMDVKPIVGAVEKLENEITASKLQFKQIEYWRDQIIQNGDQAINHCCQQFTQMDRQKLRQLSRNYQQSKDDDKRARFARQIFRELQATMSRD